MPTNVTMPQLGESVVEGTVTKWLKHEGDRISEYEPIVEINTDKVDAEIPASASGVLLKIYVPEGTTVKAGTLLAVIGQPGEVLADSTAPASDAAPAGDGAAAAVDVEAHPGSQTLQRRSAPREAPAGPAGPPRDLGFVSPAVAGLAEEHHLDLQQVAGTGRGGRISKKDVLDYLETRQTPAGPPGPETEADLAPWEKPGEGDLFRPAELQFGAEELSADRGGVADRSGVDPASTPQPQSGDTSLPVEGMRKLIAEHMVRSERSAPHVTTVFEADLSAVRAHLAANKDAFARDGVALTLTAYFVSAAVAALQAVPLVNSQWAEDKILLKREINIGLAVALDEGLIVPVIKRANEKTLLGLSREINDLARRARAKALKPDEVQGGTFTITNHGVSGSLLATPIINQPQAGILGVGVMQKRVVVIDDAIVIRPMVYLTLTFDHRVLDGAVADRFMTAVKTDLENWHS